MGVGLVEKYRYTFFDKLNELEDHIKDQINTYLPEFSSVDVDLLANEMEKKLTINIVVDGTAYSLALDIKAATLSLL